MVTLFDRICRFFALLSTLLLIFITCSIGYSIIARLIEIPNPFWIIQFNEYALLWITFLGTSWLLSEDKHVSIFILTARLSPRANVWLGYLHNITGAVLCGVLCWYSFLTTQNHIVRKVIDPKALDVPKGYVLAVIPLGFFLLTLQFLTKLLKKTDRWQ